METKITDVNKLLDVLASICAGAILDDEIWKVYGYKKRPRTGLFWSKLFSKTFELENYITKELLTMSLIDVLNGIKKSTVTPFTKLLLSFGVVDRILHVSKGLFEPDRFMEDVFSTYESLLKRNNTQLSYLIWSKAHGVLVEKDFAKFMIGTVRLLLNEHGNDFLCDSDYIKRLV